MAETLDDELADDVGQLMAALTTKYRKAPRELAIALARSLGLYIALAAKDPRAALDEAAALVRNTPFGKLKTMHFGSTLAEGGVRLVKPTPEQVVRTGIETLQRKPEQ